MEDRLQTCCFTGHRQLDALTANALQAKLADEIERMYCLQGLRNFITGGAMGFDTLAALSVLEARRRHRDIVLRLALPCENQAGRWPAADRRIYESIKSQADDVVYVSKEYSAECMHLRNRFMVDNSSVCVAYLVHAGGGTAYTVKYAKRQGLTLIRLN